MTFGITLTTTHPGIQTLVSSWLADACLVLPGPVELVVEVGPLPLVLPDHRQAFRQGRVLVRSGSATERVVVEWEPGLGRAELEPDSRVARVTVTEEGLAKTNELLRSFLLNVCILLLRRVGLHHVHGATLKDPQQRGWMLVGVSGSGKSTTTALLAKNGWGVGTDDIAFLAAGATSSATEVVAWRERLALRDDSVTAIGHTGGTVLPIRRKTGWFPEELGTTWESRVTPEILAFPTVRNDSPTTVTPIRARDALSRLMQCSPWVALESGLADDNLALMSRLTTQARTVEIMLGRDLFERPDLMQELVG